MEQQSMEKPEKNKQHVHGIMWTSLCFPPILRTCKVFVFKQRVVFFFSFYLYSIGWICVHFGLGVGRRALHIRSSAHISFHRIFDQTQISCKILLFFHGDFDLKCMLYKILVTWLKTLSLNPMALRAMIAEWLCVYFILVECGDVELVAGR